MNDNSCAYLTRNVHQEMYPDQYGTWNKHITETLKPICTSVVLCKTPNSTPKDMYLGAGHENDWHIKFALDIPPIGVQ